MIIKTTAILFDTRSIQRYIFSGNRLKTNIGASYLVDRLFIELLPHTLKEVLEPDRIDDDWEKERSDWSALTEKTLIGYIGGGNALVLLQEGLDQSKAREIISRFTKEALTTHPGLKTGAAVGTLYLNEKGEFLTEAGQPDSANGLTPLVKKLKEYQNTVFPAVNIPYTGLTLLCPENDETADKWDTENKRFVSSEYLSKFNAANNANKQLKAKLIDTGLLSEADFESLDFPSAIDRLGQQETENFFAIVHIDGNNMGRHFAECKTLTARRTKSLKVSSITARSFARLVQSIIAEYPSYDTGNFLKLKKEAGITFLPIRPIVIGGDDVTFVCAAKLALTFAERFMGYMLEEGIDTCAGIAILGTSYPFFRGYELTEALCSAAKKKSRAETDTGKHACWLDFAILNGEQAPTLEQIRENEYQAAEGSLHFGPWWAGGDAAPGEHIEQLKNLKQTITALQKMPRGKVKELRRIIPRSQGERQTFITQLTHLGLKLPEINGWEKYASDLWAEHRTPYIDAIEMMDFYRPDVENEEE